MRSRMSGSPRLLKVLFDCTGRHPDAHAGAAVSTAVEDALERTDRYTRFPIAFQGLAIELRVAPSTPAVRPPLLIELASILKRGVMAAAPKVDAGGGAM